MTLTSYFMEATYLIASILFIFALKGMSHPETARRGMFLAEGGMFAAIVGTLIGAHIVTWVWIIAGLALGSVLGAWMAIWVPMTAMPQRTALSHAFGAFAAALVGIGEFLVHGSEMSVVTRGALGFEIMLGSLTTTGSLIACGKLQGIIHGKPIQFRGQNFVNLDHLSRHGRVLRFFLDPSRSAPRVLFHAGHCLCVRRDAGDPHRLGRYAGGDVAFEFLCRPGFGGHRFCARQQRAHHCRNPRWIFGIHLVGPDVQGDEPVDHQCLVWRIRRRGGGSDGQCGRRDARDQPRRCGDATGICQSRRVCAGLRTGNRAGATCGPRAC